MPDYFETRGGSQWPTQPEDECRRCQMPAYAHQRDQAVERMLCPPAEFREAYTRSTRRVSIAETIIDKSAGLLARLMKDAAKSPPIPAERLKLDPIERQRMTVPEAVRRSGWMEPEGKLARNNPIKDKMRRPDAKEVQLEQLRRELKKDLDELKLADDTRRLEALAGYWEVTSEEIRALREQIGPGEFDRWADNKDLIKQRIIAFRQQIAEQQTRREYPVQMPMATSDRRKMDGPRTKKAPAAAAKGPAVAVGATRKYFEE